MLALEGCVQPFLVPAERALLPSLTGDEQLATANALAGQSGDVSRLVGSAVGGLLVAGGGLAPVAAVDAASFVVSAALVARLPGTVRTPRAVATSLRGRVRAVGREWSEGLRLSTQQRLGIVAVLAAQGAGYVLAGAFVLVSLGESARPSLAPGGA